MGFMVLVGEKEITLPTGDVIESGLAFRNEFHLTKFCKFDSMMTRDDVSIPPSVRTLPLMIENHKALELN